MKFNTREEYVEAVKQWKIAYKQLSQQIRDGKAARVMWQKAWSKAEAHTQSGNYSEIYKLCRQYLSIDARYQALYDKYNPTKNQYWQYPHYWTLKKDATKMLEERKLARVEAQRQYLEAKKDLTFAAV
jgi:hypothetical protein